MTQPDKNLGLSYFVSPFLIILICYCLFACASGNSGDNSSDVSDDPVASATMFFSNICALMKAQPPQNAEFLEMVDVDDGEPSEVVAIQWMKWMTAEHKEREDAVKEHFGRDAPQFYRTWKFCEIKAITATAEHAEIKATRSDGKSGEAIMYLTRKNGGWIIDGRTLVERLGDLADPNKQEARKRAIEIVEKITNDRVNLITNNKATWQDVEKWFQ